MPGDSLIIRFTGTDDQITLLNTLNNSAADQIEQIRFDDGTQWTVADVKTQLNVVTSGDDHIRGTSSSDALTGGAGNDIIIGYDGSDTYTFTRGDGVDSILDQGWNDTDVVRIVGYDPAEVSLSVDGASPTNLVLRFAGTNDQLTIANGLAYSTEDHIERIEFGDGTVWTISEIEQILAAGWGSDGDDVVSTETGSQTLDGGLGDDRLSAGDGDDTYVFARGDGHDVVADGGDIGTDTLRINGYLPAEISLTRSRFNAKTVEVSFSGSSDRVTLVDALNDQNVANRIERIEFEDGTVWTLADHVPPAGTGGATSPDQVVTGDDGDNTLAGGTGTDWLAGGEGGDTYIFARGDGADFITDGATGDWDVLRINGYLPSEAISTRGARVRTR